MKSPYEDQRTGDERRKKIKNDDRGSALVYLRKFLNWVEKWQRSKKAGLPRQTFEALIRTSKAMIHLVEYILDEKPVIEYILPGFLQQDPLEGRFGWYRQLCGANYFNNVLQFIEAEKTIRLHSLVKSGFDMNAIKDIFEEVSNQRTAECCKEISQFTELLQDFKFERK